MVFRIKKYGVSSLRNSNKKADFQRFRQSLENTNDDSSISNSNEKITQLLTQGRKWLKLSQRND